MHVGWILLALVASAALAGCTAGDTTNPNLAAPKLVVGARPDGNLSVFVHGAFGDRLYDWIHLEVDNVTLVNDTDVFSVERVIPPGFYITASAQNAKDIYALRARIDHDMPDERLLVSLVNAEERWGDPQEFAPPFERLMERRGSSS